MRNQSILRRRQIVCLATGFEFLHWPSLTHDWIVSTINSMYIFSVNIFMCHQTYIAYLQLYFYPNLKYLGLKLLAPINISAISVTLLVFQFEIS